LFWIFSLFYADSDGGDDDDSDADEIDNSDGNTACAAPVSCEL